MQKGLPVKQGRSSLESCTRHRNQLFFPQKKSIFALANQVKMQWKHATAMGRSSFLLRLCFFKHHGMTAPELELRCNWDTQYTRGERSFPSSRVVIQKRGCLIHSIQLSLIKMTLFTTTWVSQRTIKGEWNTC